VNLVLPLTTSVTFNVSPIPYAFLVSGWGKGTVTSMDLEYGEVMPSVRRYRSAVRAAEAKNAV